MKNLENKNAENNSDNLKWYFENEKNLTILAKGKKNPIVKNWLDKLLPYSSITEYFRNGYNIGFVLSDTDLVVDCDPRNYKDGTDSLEQLQNDLGVRLQDHAPTVKTGGGGFHFYSLNLSRSFLKDDALTVTLQAGNFINPKRSFRTTVITDTFESTEIWQPNFLRYSIGVKYNLGKLKAVVKKVARTIQNTDNVDAPSDSEQQSENGGMQ